MGTIGNLSSSGRLCRVAELTQSSGRLGCAGCVERTRHWAPRCRPFVMDTKVLNGFVTSSRQNGWFQNAKNIPVGSAASVDWLRLDQWDGGIH